MSAEDAVAQAFVCGGLLALCVAGVLESSFMAWAGAVLLALVGAVALVYRVYEYASARKISGKTIESTENRSLRLTNWAWALIVGVVCGCVKYRPIKKEHTPHHPSPSLEQSGTSVSRPREDKTRTQLRIEFRHRSGRIGQLTDKANSIGMRINLVLLDRTCSVRTSSWAVIPAG